MLRLNIQTTSAGLKSYVKKVKSCCLPVMYATSNSNLNANWRGTSKFIPEFFLFATSAQKVSRGKTPNKTTRKCVVKKLNLQQ